MSIETRVALFAPVGGQIEPRWRRSASGSGEVTAHDERLRLELRPASAAQLSLAQLDDAHWPAVAGWRPPLRLSLRARWSHATDHLVGTSGVGFWNYPWGPEGFSRPPVWAWFAHYSPPSRVTLDPDGPGHGPRAAVMAAPAIGPLALLAGNLALRLPGAARLAGQVARRLVPSGDVALPTDLSAWRHFALDWQPDGVRFSLNGIALAATPARVRGPLSFVAWMDNQWAALRPDGTAASGLLAVAQHQWLDIADLTIVSGAGGQPGGADR